MGGRTVLRESSTSRELSLLTTRRLLRHSRFQIDGVALRRLRIERNMPQTQMAEQSGYSQPSISDLETGRHSMLPMEDIQSLASALGVAPEAIIRAPAGVEQKLEG
jgi:DNA-binding Xre family transcriptional regulator